MVINDDEIREIYTDHFKEIYLRCTPELMAKISNNIKPFCNELAATFYQTVLKIGGSEGFLTDELVESRLQRAMAHWIDSLFLIRNGVELDDYIEYQLTAGRVHARINLPPHLFNCGVRVLKQELGRILRKGDVSLNEYNQSSTLTYMLIDLSTSLMNESYFGDIVVGERKSQSLQLHMNGSELALKCEQLRAETYSWHTKVLSILREESDLNSHSIPSISHSEIGLWVMHKAPLFFPASEHVRKIQKDLAGIDSHVKEIVAITQSDESIGVNAALKMLDVMVKGIATTLSSLAEHSISLDSGRDPLTRLFNRRYLDTVLKKESHFCMIHKKSYVLMLLDIDHFKQINDSYGHDAGDRVLEQLSELLGQDIRAGDFVFRYGGEEFLILLVDMKIEFVVSIAEQLLNTIRGHEFNIGKDKALKCTVSIGISSHQGQPDYKRVITNADKALYEAKDTGRNKYVIFRG